MSVLRRAFVAVVPPPVVARWTAAAADVVQGHNDAALLRWTPVAQHHLTLQFLGRVDDDASLADGLAGSLGSVAPFEVALGGAGAFPAARRASVLWLGVRQGSAALGALAHAVSGATQALGVVPEDRPFRPHVTLARANRARDVRVLVDRLDALPPGPVWTVRDAVLFESASSTRDGRTVGAVHSEIARVRLAG